MFNVRQALALPGTPEANTLYLISTAVDGTVAEAYITSSTGNPRSIGNTALIQSIVNTALADKDKMEITGTIATRDALGLTSNCMVLVTDASADPTVTAGAASYAYDHGNDTFTKISEFESQDISLTWAALTDGPSSTPAQVDLAVTNSHTHANKTQLDKVGEATGGIPTYDTQPLVRCVETAW